MGYVLDIETERLQEMMRMLGSAVDEIDHAAERLRQITTHNDWGCKERNIINNYSTENRNNALKLQTDCRNFSNAVHQVVGEFVEGEKSISGLFPSVDGPLAKILSEMTHIITNGSLPTVSGIGRNIDSIIKSHQIIRGGDWKPIIGTVPKGGSISWGSIKKIPNIYDVISPVAVPICKVHVRDLEL